MPTENRSSNTEVVGVPFQREDRYIVVKRRDLALLSPVDSDLAHSYLEGVLSLMDEWNCPAREYLVLESDWPEFAPAWAAIERRVTGSPAQQPHPEPIAWMVGTAFWWTKEEAERDAAETGLPIVGLGPMAGVAAAQQDQGEPVAYRQRFICPVEGPSSWVLTDSNILSGRDGWEVVPLYTHADPNVRWKAVADEQMEVIAGLKAEVERLRAELDEWKKRCQYNADTAHDIGRERDTLRAQLDERGALLSSVQAEVYEAAVMASVIREAKPFAISTTLFAPVRKFELGDAISKAGVLVERLSSIADTLSASAEPVTPQREPEKPSRCTNCDNCMASIPGTTAASSCPTASAVTTAIRKPERLITPVWPAPGTLSTRANERRSTNVLHSTVTPLPSIHCRDMAAKDEVMPEEKHLIRPLKVERDKYGFWTHPAWPDDGDECALPFSWFGEHGLEYCVIEMENDAPEGMMEAWMDDGDYDCTPWQPSKPAGDGWFTFSIHDTEDGPVCVWVRPKVSE